MTVLDPDSTITIIISRTYCQLLILSAFSRIILLVLVLLFFKCSATILVALTSIFGGLRENYVEVSRHSTRRRFACSLLI